MPEPPLPRDDGWLTEADGVFRGGGVKALGLVGALLGFGEHPRRPVTQWVNVAGTSAGAVIAAYLACDRAPAAATRMIDALDLDRLAALQDFPLGRRYLGGVPRLFARHGMAPGRALEAWLDGVLGGATFELARPADGSDDWSRSRLKLIAFDVTNERLLVLPEDLRTYSLPGGRQPIDPATFPISKAVRISTSIPFVFDPVVLHQIAVPDPNHASRVVPVSSTPATIVDGGLLSNFPVWLFDDPNPKRPTFGFTLSTSGDGARGLRHAMRRLPWPLTFGMELFEGAQHAWDTRFATRSTGVRTIAVDTTVALGDGSPYTIGTTEFDLTDDIRRRLIGNGHAAATRYLDEFDEAAHINTFHATPWTTGLEGPKGRHP